MAEQKCLFCQAWSSVNVPPDRYDGSSSAPGLAVSGSAWGCESEGSFLSLCLSPAEDSSCSGHALNDNVGLR